MPRPPLSPTVRTAAGLIALVAALSLAISFAVDRAELGAPGALWSMARYFTNLTNAVVAVVFGATALRGRWPGAGWPAAATVWIVIVGVVYHVLLAATHNPEGIEVWSNIGLHTVTPLGALALWTAAAPKAPLPATAPLVWTIFPMAYAGYALLRGAFDGVYPYFFLDPAKSGLPTVLAYVLGLGLFFVAAGALLVSAARFLHDRQKRARA